MKNKTKENSKKSCVYNKDAMKQDACMICGEHTGGYIYRDKSVCPSCIEYIRINH